MIATLALCFALGRAQQDGYQTDIGSQSDTLLVVYKEMSQAVSGMQGSTSKDVQGTSLAYKREGMMGYSVIDGGLAGTPCKIYKGDGDWAYKTSVKNSAHYEYHTASFKMTYYVGLDGVPIHTESHFQDEGESSLTYTDVKADYRRDHIDVTIDKDGYESKTQVYPNYGMERYAAMFEPMIRSGLVQSRDRDCVFLHPYTGMPFEFHLHLKSRFTGHYFFLPQAGYTIEVTSKEGEGTMYVTRQGQLIKMDLPDRHDASLESGPLADERKDWGQFNLTDWDKAVEETNPERPKYTTLIAPVLLTNPRLLFPVPCVIAQ